MPAELRIDAVGRIVFTRLFGVVTDDDFLSLTRFVVDSPEMRPGFSELCDLRDSTRVEISADALRRNLAMTEPLDRHPSRRSARIAVVAPNDAAFGVARMYESMRADSPVGVRAFRDVDDARDWLGLPRGDEDAPPSPGDSSRRVV